MKRVLAIGLLLLIGSFAFAQDSILRSTKSYLIADDAEKDIAFLKEKSRQASLDLGLTVLANRIPTDSKLVAPHPSKHLLKHGRLQLQLPIDAEQTEFAVYHSEVFDQPGTINVLQIDDELVTYRTTEKTGNIHLFYHCVRGAYGTRKAAHDRNAVVYKLWDTPERTLLPDLEVQDQMALSEAKKLAKTDCPLLIFNDLKSYAYNEQGDEAIAHFLDTMHKYNPDKLLQADLLTPASKRRLNRINENELWNETMRTKIIETLAEKQAFYRKNQMPWMIGNFQIHLADKNRKATTLEELEWFLSKAAAFEAGFGLDCSAETMLQHGLTDDILNTINLWESLRLDSVFSEEQKDMFKDPYGNWHLQQADDSTCLLYPQHVSRRYFCRSTDDTWEWNSPYYGHFALRIEVEGRGSLSNPSLLIEDGTLLFPCILKAKQYLIYNFDGTAYITDQNYNTIEEVYPQGTSYLPEGSSEVTFNCETQSHPEVSLRFMTRGEPEEIRIP